MRTLAILGMSACAALLAAPALAEGESGASRGRWMGTPTLPLHAPGMRPPPGGWGQNGWSHGGHHRQPMRFRRGFVMPGFYVTPQYHVSDWDRYGLARPGDGRRWVRHQDDAYLVDGRGMIHDEAYWIDWDRHDRGPVPNYVGRGADDDYYGDDMVTMGGRGFGGGPDDEGYPGMVDLGGGRVIHMPPGGGAVVVVQGAPCVTTTTTTTTSYVSAAPAKRAWRPAKTKLIKLRK